MIRKLLNFWRDLISRRRSSLKSQKLVKSHSELSNDIIISERQKELLVKNLEEDKPPAEDIIGFQQVKTSLEEDQNKQDPHKTPRSFPDSQSQPIPKLSSDEKEISFSDNFDQEEQIPSQDEEKLNFSIEEEKAIEKNPRTIIIGIDLGTNSTKVIYQILELFGQKNAYIFNFNNQISGFPPGSLPSIVIVQDKKFYFGDEAYQRRQHADASFSSFKMCLGCLYDIIPCKNCSAHGLNSFTKGIYTHDLFKLNAADVTVFYLAYIISIIRNFLENKYGTYYELDIYYNICFPLNFIEKHKSTFQKMVVLVDRLSKKIYQGINIRELYHYYQQASKNANDEHLDNYELIEETRASTFSVIKSGFLEYNKYAVIDIGASTTDISIFRYWGFKNNRPKFFYYADQSFPIGGNDFDASIFKFIKTHFKHKQIDDFYLLNKIKIAKEKIVENNGFNLEEFQLFLNEDEICSVCKNNLKKIQTIFSQLLRDKAFEKEQKLSEWKELNILLLGGGSQWKQLYEELRKPPFFGNNIEWYPNFIEPAIPDNLNLEESTLNPYEIKNHFFYYYVAHGLSYSKFDIHKIEYPSEVPPLQIEEEKIDLPDRDELYPK